MYKTKGLIVKMDNQILNVAGYGRVSTLKQFLEGTSAEDQKNRILKECKIKGWKLFNFYSDDGFSGKTMEHRPGIQKLIKDAKDGKFDAVLFTKLDRVGRTLRELLNFWELIQENYNLDLICIDVPQISTEGSFGKMVLHIFGAFAEFERDLIRERMSSGRLFKWKEGKSVVGALPYGYKWDEERVKPHPKQAPVVKRIYSMYINENFSMKSIAIKLTEEGIPTPSADKNWKEGAVASRWNNFSVGKILKNPAYTSREIELNKNKRATAVSKRTKREYTCVTDELKPDSEWVKISFPRLIADEWWERAQERRKHQKRKPKKKHVKFKEHFLAENVVYCGECGGRMGRRPKREVTKTGEIIRFYYVCYWKDCSKKELKMKGRERCILNSVDAELVDRDIWHEIVKVLSNPAKYAEEWFLNPDVDELQKRVAKLKDDTKSAKQNSVLAYKYAVSTKDPELRMAYHDEWKKYEEEYYTIKRRLEKNELELKAVTNKIDLLVEYKKYMEHEAKKSAIDRWYNGDATTPYDKGIRKFLFSLPFNERKRITEAVISPESGGRVRVRYQKPADYVDHEDFLTMEPELLDEPQLDRPEIIDLVFRVDLERIRAIISSLSKEKLLKKFDRRRTAQVYEYI